ncbi:MAG TPA: hypothetical protein VMB49_21925 [Acidobacteriaceae bacterium]|nr:hypothetical protein [Acidobacteriaceae bacterium]
MNDPEVVPNPARRELDQPRLPSDELEREIGDSEPWDEGAEDAPDDPRPDP